MLAPLGAIAARPIILAQLAQAAPASSEVTEATVVAEAQKGKEAIRKFLAEYGLALSDLTPQEDMVVEGLKNKYSGYPALAVNIIRVLDGKKLDKGQGDGQPSLMTINGSVREKLGVNTLTPGQKVDDKLMKDAILLRWNERNSCCMRETFEALLVPKAPKK